MQPEQKNSFPSVRWQTMHSDMLSSDKNVRRQIRQYIFFCLRSNQDLPAGLLELIKMPESRKRTQLLIKCIHKTQKLLTFFSRWSAHCSAYEQNLANFDDNFSDKFVNQFQLDIHHPDGDPVLLPTSVRLPHLGRNSRFTYRVGHSEQ